MQFCESIKVAIWKSMKLILIFAEILAVVVMKGLIIVVGLFAQFANNCYASAPNFHDFFLEDFIERMETSTSNQYVF